MAKKRSKPSSSFSAHKLQKLETSSKIQIQLLIGALLVVIAYFLSKNMATVIKSNKVEVLSELTMKHKSKWLPVELHHNFTSYTSVRIYKINNFLSNEECEGLLVAHSKHVSESAKTSPLLCFADVSTLQAHLNDVGVGHLKASDADFTQGTTCVNETFSKQLSTLLSNAWSQSTSFYRNESPFAPVLENRIFEVTSLLPNHGGKFQITSYPTAIGYKKHHDCVPTSRNKKDRFATVLVYLNDVSSGGETIFTELNVSVTPKRGMALIWSNMDANGECESLSKHEAAPVKSGWKAILQRWYYYERFEMLGIRAPEPALPRRRVNQPRVSCDLYQHGSCRWYDEWNYEHIVDYAKNKHFLL